MLVFMPTAVQYVVCAFFFFLRMKEMCAQQYYVQNCCTAVQ